MNAKDLQTILDLHNLWLEGNANGQKANLSRADLREADLNGANLREADLNGADLSRADLRGANLSGADLSVANFYVYQGSRHTAYFSSTDSMLRIGCEYHTIDHWLQEYKAIGDYNNYSDKEIQEYFIFIRAFNDIRGSYE